MERLEECHHRKHRCAKLLAQQDFLYFSDSGGDIELVDDGS
jgi:hypothetical protein